MMKIAFSLADMRIVLPFLLTLICVDYHNEAFAEVKSASVELMPLQVDIPACKRDVTTWSKYSPIAEWMDRHVENWRSNPRALAVYKRKYRADRERWLKEDVVDLTWIDMNGDGWCDVITSGDSEPYKSAERRPIVLRSPRGIYIHTSKGFKPFNQGVITGEYEGSSFTAYWDKASKSVVLFERVYQGNLGGGGDKQELQFHVRTMLGAAFAALKAGDKQASSDYYDEVASFFYNGQLSDEEAENIWKEEARRAGVDVGFRGLY